MRSTSRNLDTVLPFLCSMFRQYWWVSCDNNCILTPNSWLSRSLDRLWKSENLTLDKDTKLYKRFPNYNNNNDNIIISVLPRCCCQSRENKKLVYFVIQFSNQYCAFSSVVSGGKGLLKTPRYWCLLQELAQFEKKFSELTLFVFRIRGAGWGRISAIKSDMWKVHRT